MTIVNVFDPGGPGDSATARAPIDSPPLALDPAPVRAWRELLLCYCFYFAYARTRGASDASPGEARRNAWTLVEWERALGLYHERALQRVALLSDEVVAVFNFFYGTAHFLVTPAVAVWLVVRSPATYRRWRNVLAWTTGLALVGYLAFPLMPPRLMWGLGFTDTMATHANPWALTLMPVWNVANPYAAMPSLHMAWSLWVAFVVLAHARRPLVRALARAYPVATLLTIVVTGNHFVLDAVGGALVFWIGYQVVPWARATVDLPARRPALTALPEQVVTTTSVRSRGGPDWGMEGVTRVG